MNLNYVFLALFALVIFGTGLTVAILVLTSIANLSIASLLPLTVSLILVHVFYNEIKQFDKKGNLGLRLFERLLKFISKKRYVLLIVTIIAGVIYFRHELPSNIFISVIGLFSNPFAQIEIQLFSFLGKTAASLITLVIQSMFVYLIVSIGDSVVGKIFKTGQRPVSKRRKHA